MSTAAKLNPIIRQARHERADTRKRIIALGAMPCFARERITRIVKDSRFPAAYKQSQHEQLLYDLEEAGRKKKAEIEGLEVKQVPIEPEGWDANGAPVA